MPSTLQPRNNQEEYKEVDFNPFAGNEIEKIVPTNEAQREIWLSCVLGGLEANLSYNQSFTLELDGSFDDQSFSQAVHDLTIRHESLRSTFSGDGETLIIYTDYPIDIIRHEEASLSRKEFDQRFNKFVQQEVGTQFDLEEGPLIRYNIHKWGNYTYVTITVHHIIGDGWSIGVILQDLGKIYSSYLRSEDPTLLRPSQISEYIQIEADFKESLEYKATEDFWVSLYKDYVSTCELPSDFPRKNKRSYESARTDLKLDEEIVASLRKISVQTRCSLPTVLISAFELFIYKATYQKEIIIGLPTSGQAATGSNTMVGHCVNLLPIKSTINPSLSFTEYLAKRKSELLDAYEHQRFTFGELVKKLFIKRDEARATLVPIVLNIDTSFAENISFEGLKHRLINNPRAFENFEIFLNINQNKQETIFEWAYNTNLYRAGTIKRFHQQLVEILNQVIANNHVSIKDLLFDNVDERINIKSFDDTLNSLLYKAADDFSYNTALRHEGEYLTYKDLSTKSNQLARLLVSKGAKPGNAIGILTNRSIETIIALVAIVKIGAAYVPIEASLPSERSNFILKNAGVKVVLTAEYLDVYGTDIDTLVMSEALAESSTLDGSNLKIQIGDHDLIYILHTSGSTGKPKGVCMGQKALVNLLLWQREHSIAGPNSKTLQFSPLSFDVSFQEIFSTFITGGELVLLSEETRLDPDKLLKHLNHWGINRIFMPFVALQALTESTVVNTLYPLKLREVISAGEQLKITPQIRLFFSNIKNCTLFNQYGPTECHVVTEYKLDGDATYWPSLPSIGKEIANTKILILNEQLQEVTPGEIGELCISGMPLAEGYQNLPEITSEKFVTLINTNGLDMRIYRTGDLARLLPDRNIELLGRKDCQVKVRGYRIELGEIEHQLTSQKGIKDAIVTAREDTPGVQQLVAFLIPDNNTTNASPVSIKENLRAFLPDYMIPNQIVWIDKFPTTTSGKVDRKSLPKPPKISSEITSAALPQTDKEKLIAKVWSELLHVNTISLNSNFFELGGHSLIAIKALIKLEELTGIKPPLTSLFKYPDLKQFAKLYDFERSFLPSNTQVEEAEAFIGQDIIELPILEPQSEIWLACMLGGDLANKSYNISISNSITGNLDKNALEASFRDLIKRHQSLRSTVTADGKSIQIHRQIEAKLDYVDLSLTGENEQSGAINDFYKSKCQALFDLTKGPLFRASLIKIRDDEHLFILTAHHIICDGYSMEIIKSELSTLYNATVAGKSPKIEKTSSWIQYVERKTAFYYSRKYQTVQEFWTMQFKNNTPVLNLPIDYVRPAVRTYEGSSMLQEFDSKSILAMKNIGSKHGCSLSLTLRALFEIFISRISGQNDVVIGQLSSDQLASGHPDLVGHCVNLLPIRSIIEDEHSFNQYLENRKVEILEVYDHEEITLGSLLKELRIDREQSRPPLVSVLLNSTIGLNEELRLNGLIVRPYNFESDAEKFELSVKISGDEQSPTFEWNYYTRLFRPESIQRMTQEFEHLLTEISINPDLPIRELTNPFLPSNASHSFEFPANTTVLDLFEQQVKDNPKAVALVFEGKTMTFEQLSNKSDCLAAYLLSQRIGQGNYVPICFHPSFEMVIAILGLWKSGNAYAPIDPNFPTYRISCIIEEIDAGLILCHSSTAKQLAESGNKLINLDQEQIIASSISPNTYQLERIDLPAYIIYTSGSTGKPKGVIIDHKALADYFFGLQAHLSIKECKSFALATSIATDLGNTTLFGSLAFGGTLHLFSKDNFNNISYIHSYFTRHPIDCLKLVPSHWKSLSKDGNGLYPAKLLIFGGETLHKELVNSIIESPEATCTIVNHYGPTETTIGKLLHIVDSTARYNETIPIGKPFSNNQVYVLDHNAKMCPIGIPGELFISGVGLSRGYYKQEQLTREKFKDNTLNANDKYKMYRTGDIVRYLANGDLEYLGRTDNQIKVRGNRIEIGEIENVLYQFDGISQCFIDVQEDTQNHKHIVGYIVPIKEFHEADLNAFLKARLPVYMLPQTLIKLEKIPLTINGKIDRSQIPTAQLSTSNCYAAPKTELEVKLASLWQKLLNVKKVSMTDNFFQLGGHSLIAIQFMMHLEKETGKRLPLSTLFEYGSLHQIVELVYSENEKVSSLVNIKPTGSKTPLYIVHGQGLNVLNFSGFASYMDAEQPVYGIQAKGLDGVEEPLDNMEDIAEYYTSAILDHNPDGPFAIAGYSFGGYVAIEIARRLKLMCKDVKMVGIFDTNARKTELFKGTRFEQYKNTIRRQGLKVKWILRSLLTTPEKTLNYQVKFFTNRAKRITQSIFLGNNEQHENVYELFSYINNKHTYALKNYKMQPYDGEIDLFLASERIYFVEDPKYLGWRAYCKEVKVHHVEGDHKTMLEAPNDKRFANVLQAVTNQRLRTI